MDFFCEKVNGWMLITILAKTLHLICLTGFWIIICRRHLTSFVVFTANFEQILSMLCCFHCWIWTNKYWLGSSYPQYLKPQNRILLYHGWPHGVAFIEKGGVDSRSNFDCIIFDFFLVQLHIDSEKLTFLSTYATRNSLSRSLWKMFLE